MHILFTRFPFASAEGGAENQTTWLWDGLRGKGHNVSFLGSCSVLLRRAQQLTMNNEQLTIGSPPVTKFGAISFLWRKAAMRKRLIERVAAMTPKPDVIVMLSLSEKLLLTEWAVKNNIRVVWVEHDTVGRWLTKNPWLKSLQYLSTQVTTVCVSELSRKMYVDLGWSDDRTVAVANGVPFPAGAQGPKLSTYSSLHLGCIARLSPEKGVDVLLAAISDIPEVTLTIVGRGTEEGYIRKLIADDTIRHGTPRVQLLRRVDDLETFYSSIDALVLPSSDHDPFGLTAAEAMMLGVPVIVTDRCGIAYYLQSGRDALIVSAESEFSLAEAIAAFLNAETRARIGEAGKVTAGRSFSLVQMVTAYEHVLDGRPL